ncbi:MAG: Spy/CpxP family protein refolding chaperone [Burkholderiaceae bacterium]|nr:Spy/CpxP family protein refolding chaperone [Burkholderiaceae bacterium]
MKTWMRRSLIGGALLSVLALVGGLAACSHRPHGPGFALSDAEAQQWRERMVERIGQRMDLDAAQKARLATLGEALDGQRKALMPRAADGQPGAPRRELQALIAGPQFDRAAAQALLDGKTQAVREQGPKVLTAAADFYDSLRPEQQQQLRQALAEGRHRWGRGG